MNKDKTKETKKILDTKPILTDIIPDNMVKAGVRSRFSPSQLMPMVNSSLVQYHNANKNIVKRCAKKYVRANILEANLLRFMLRAINYEHVDFLLSDCIPYNMSEYEESEYITDSFSTKISRDERWFNDLMLYLSGVYSDGQLLNADFFKVIQNKRAQRAFIENMQRINVLKNYKLQCSQRAVKETKTKIDGCVANSKQNQK